MRFIGDGFLVSASEYETTDKQGELVTRYKYSFLVGDLDVYLEDASLEVCTSDVPLLTGKEKFMSKVRVECVVKPMMEKGADGRYHSVQKPVYRLMDQSKGV